MFSYLRQVCLNSVALAKGLGVTFRYMFQPKAT